MTQPGRYAASLPTELSWRELWQVTMRVMDEMDRRNLALFAAGIAFYSLLSIFPALAALIALWGFVADPAMIRTVLDLAEQLLPEGTFALFDNQVAALIDANTSTLGLTTLISFALAMWTARNAVASTIRGLNTIYREQHRQNPVKRYAMAVLLTLVLILVAITAFAAILVLPAVLSFLPLPLLLTTTITAVKWAIVLAVVFFGIGLLYRYGPNRRPPRVPWITPGAIFALSVWTAGSIGFSIYMSNFANFNEIYGSIGAVIGVLLWFYISAFMVLLGAQINAELELSTTLDTTRGRTRPGGTRDAYTADYVIGEEGEPVRAVSVTGTEETG